MSRVLEIRSHYLEQITAQADLPVLHNAMPVTFDEPMKDVARSGIALAKTRQTFGSWEFQPAKRKARG